MRKSKYPAYDQAKSLALDLQLNSRSQYIKWHTDSKCNYLPRYPERVYPNEWVSWNDWLGTANVFRGEKITPVRPFWDAVKWAQAHAALHELDTMKAWVDWCQDHVEELPKDIPSRPDTRYVEWEQAGWKTWLGTDIRGRLLAAKTSTALIAVCSFHNLRRPGNFYAIVQAEKGEAELKQILDASKDLRVVRVYAMPNDVKEEVFAVVNTLGRREDDGWFVPLIGNLLYELDLMLQVWNPSNNNDK